MIKFFRKFRLKLIAENRFGQYLIYSVGEIILVVIGILIALSINNWNENRKQKQIINSLYAIIVSDLQSDIKKIDWVFRGMMPKDTIFQSVMKKEMTREDYINCGSRCISILGGFPDITFNSRGIKLLEEYSTVFDSHHDSLAVYVSNFYTYFNTEIGVSIEEVILDYNDNRYYFKNNKDWYVDYEYGGRNDEMIDYFLCSTDYQNRVHSFYDLYYVGYLRQLKSYKEDAQDLIEQIKIREK